MSFVNRVVNIEKIMSARQFNKRIEVWQTVAVADGSGGNTVSENIITTTWAKLETLDSTQITTLGLDYTKSSLLVTVRKRKDFIYNSKTIYIKYKGNKYTITSYPTDEDFISATISFIAQIEKQQSYPEYLEIT